MLTGNTVLRKHQRNAIRILKDKEENAMAQYIEALKSLMTVYALQPSSDNPSAFLDWKSRLNKVKLEHKKAFDKYNRAFNSRLSYERVAMGVW